ncbi:MAG TPA: S41 family peptidase, partial [Sphingobacteriaceae bacterium]
GSRAELTKDSIFLYAREVYLWNDALPTYQAFNPRRYTESGTEIDNYNRELFDITQLKINPQTGRPYEFVSSTANYAKYSYLTDEESDDPARSGEVSLEGVGTDFGFTLTGVGSESLYQIFIRYVNPGSPAANLGMSRGDVLTQVNGRQLGSNFTADANFINSAFDQQSISVSGRKSNGATFTRTLSKTTYTSSPVFKDTVITRAGKSIGYMALARFSNLSNAEPALNEAFSGFASANITDLVVDLRYNGGGYVATAEHLINLIAQPRLNGTTMFVEHFNKTMQDGQATILKNQPLLDENGRQRFANGRALTYFDVDYSVSGNTYEFLKRGAVNSVTNVVFIVTGNTASASELVINSLRPHINVKIVGEQSYGKPVGFFPINIDVYDVYYSLFQSRNSAGEGDYFAGFTPDANTADDVTRDFGDPLEASFASALSYLTAGTFIAHTPAPIKIMGKAVNPSLVEFRDMGRGTDFKGMIENRMKIKQK